MRAFAIWAKSTEKTGQLMSGWQNLIRVNPYMKKKTLKSPSVRFWEAFFIWQQQIECEVPKVFFRSPENYSNGSEWIRRPEAS